MSMTHVEDSEFIELAFKKLKERGWIGELTPSSITEENVEKFEQMNQIELPPLYREFLKSYQLPRESFEINGIAETDEISPLWLTLYGLREISQLTEHMKAFRNEAVDFRKASDESCDLLIPIGDWGAGFGPLCLDLTRRGELVNKDDETTWSLVWFDHEEFDWSAWYMGEDGLLHGSPAAPDFKTLLEWYFCGSLEKQFEMENQVKITYERLNDRNFCQSYWDDKWKE